MKLKVILIGLGNIGMGYDYYSLSDKKISTLASAFYYHNAFELLCGVDIDSQKRAKFEKKYSLPSYETIESTYPIYHPSVLAIATPARDHFDCFKKLINFNTVKVILCEKPIADEFVTSKDMVEMSHENRIKLFVNYSRRCDKGIINVRTRIINDEIQGPFKGVCWYSHGLFNNGSHFIDLLTYWLGEILDYEIIRKGNINRYNDIQPDIILRFRNATILLLSTDTDIYKHYSLELIAKNGILNYERDNLRWRSSKQDIDYPMYNTVYHEHENIECNHSNIQLYVVNEIAEHIAGNPTNLCTGNEALVTMKLLDNIKKSYV